MIIFLMHFLLKNYMKKIKKISKNHSKKGKEELLNKKTKEFIILKFNIKNLEKSNH